MFYMHCKGKHYPQKGFRQGGDKLLNHFSRGPTEMRWWMEAGPGANSGLEGQRLCPQVPFDP